jgi:phage-related tail protein
MTPINRKQYVDLVEACDRREGRCVRRITMLMDKIAARQNAGPVPQSARAVLSVLRLADSHEQSLHRLDAKLSEVEAQLASVREERRRLEVAAVAQEVLSEAALARSRANAEPNTYSTRSLQSYPTAELGETRLLSRNSWADRASRKAQGV